MTLPQLRGQQLSLGWGETLEERRKKVPLPWGTRVDWAKMVSQGLRPPPLSKIWTGQIELG
jgi:hypothetical protein